MREKKKTHSIYKSSDILVECSTRASWVAVSEVAEKGGVTEHR